MARGDRSPHLEPDVVPLAAPPALETGPPLDHPPGAGELVGRNDGLREVRDEVNVISTMICEGWQVKDASGSYKESPAGLTRSHIIINNTHNAHLSMRTVIWYRYMS